MNFRVALVVPDKRLPCQPRSIKYWNEHCRYDDLEAACHDDQIDLVVLPEQYYEDVSCDEMEEWAIGEWYDHLKVPVLMGFRSEEGFQIAIYVNPKSSRSETRLHRYVKHSSAERLAFEWPGYAGGSDAMFDPIVLGDARIGIQICHDMFYGLLGHRLRHRGANLHINLSGQDVNRRKWSNVLAGRSLELNAPFLCTMAKREGKGSACVLAFDQGRQLLPAVSKVNSQGFAGFEVFDLGDRRLKPPHDQSFSAKSYRDISISRNASVRADIHLIPQSGEVSLKGRCELGPVDSWRVFRTTAGSAGVLTLPIDALHDGLSIHRHDVRQSSFDHHIVAYFGEPKDLGEAITFIKLRAIEHRMAVLLVGNTTWECIKTTRYKNIQRLRPRNGVFKLNAECLGGTASALKGRNGLGMPRRHFDKYRALRPNGSAS